MERQLTLINPIESLYGIIPERMEDYIAHHIVDSVREWELAAGPHWHDLAIDAYTPHSFHCVEIPNEDPAARRVYRSYFPPLHPISEEN